MLVLKMKRKQKFNAYSWLVHIAITAILPEKILVTMLVLTNTYLHVTLTAGRQLIENEREKSIKVPLLLITWRYGCIFVLFMWIASDLFLISAEMAMQNIAVKLCGILQAQNEDGLLRFFINIIISWTVYAWG